MLIFDCFTSNIQIHQAPANIWTPPDRSSTPFPGLISILYYPTHPYKLLSENQACNKVMYTALRKQNSLVPLMMSSEGIKNTQKRQILTGACQLAYVMICLNIKQAHRVLSDSQVLGSCSVLQSSYLHPPAPSLGLTITLQ